MQSRMRKIAPSLFTALVSSERLPCLARRWGDSFSMSVPTDRHRFEVAALSSLRFMLACCRTNGGTSIVAALVIGCFLTPLGKPVAMARA